MIIGQTVFGGTYFSPWFPRRGDAALFAGEVIAAGGATLTLGLQTKNSEDADQNNITTASTGTIASVTGIGAGVVGTVTGSSLKELVRFAYVAAGSSTQWVHFRVLPPAWRMNGA